MPISNILDDIEPTLAPAVWLKPGSPEPVLKPQHAHWITSTIYDVLDKNGYSNPQRWLKLVITGSITTYQYSDLSDIDTSLWVDHEALPEWSRAEMIGIMINNMDGRTLPGTPYSMQCYVVGKKMKPSDLYKKGLRSGYDIKSHHWIEPPDHTRDHDVSMQEAGFYAYALEQADKMERMLRYEPDKAITFWHQIHGRRMHDQTAGKGDFSESNIVFKFLANRGLFDSLAHLTGEHIGKIAMPLTPDQLNNWSQNVNQYAYHQTNPTWADQVEREGIRPDVNFDQGLEGSAPGHVYMFTPKDPADTVGNAQYRVPVNKLDPSKVRFDADFASARMSDDEINRYNYPGSVYDIHKHVTGNPEFEDPEAVAQSMEVLSLRSI
jgi:hypothetical protein